MQENNNIFLSKVFVYVFVVNVINITYVFKSFCFYYFLICYMQCAENPIFAYFSNNNEICFLNILSYMLYIISSVITYMF